MFEDFDARNNQDQEDEDDSETLSYSYPSYSRFTYTGKTKSRLGRSRFMRQSGNKDETKKPDDESSGNSELKPNTHFLQSNSQAPKTPGVSWLQRDSSTHPFTPGGKSANVHGSCSGLGTLPSQSNFLFNLKNDSVQNSSCKRNLPFSTTPFKTKEVPVETQRNNNPLRELNQLLKPENPFSQLDFFSRPKEEKENTGKTKTENVKNNDLDPPALNQLKIICDAIPLPPLPASIPETNKVVSTRDPSDLRKSSESAKSSLFVPFSTERKDDNKGDDDSTNVPLDLSSAESTASRTLFSRSLMSGNDHVDGDSSGSLNRQLKDSTRESIVKADDSTTQKTNTDALSGFLPRFLVPKNKNNKTEFPDDDVSAHSVGTVVEKMIDVKHQAPFQKSQMFSQAPTKTQMTSSENRDVAITGNEVYSSSQYKSTLNNDLKKYSPPSLPISFTYKDPSPSSLPDTNNQVQSVFQPQLNHHNNKKSSPPSVPSSVVSSDPPKLSPPSANIVPDFRNLVNNGQHILKQEQNHHLQHTMKNYKEINSLAQNIDEKLEVVSKSYVNDKMIPDVNEIKNTNVSLISTNEICPSNQFKSEIKPADLINPMVINQQKLPSSNHIQRRSEPFNSLYCAVRHEPRHPTQLDSGERNLSQLSVQQPNVPKPAMIDQRDPALYTRQQENIQPSLLNQKTYLAPQQPLDRNSAGDFPHLKPEIPQPGGSKPILPAMKRLSQFKMSAARGMPSRADTELSVNGKSYGILSMLGKGGSSEVYQVLDSGTSKLLAVKCVDLSMVDKTIADGYLNEIDLLSRLQGCTSVIRMFDYEYVQECKMLYVVMEKGDTDLSHLIRDISKTKKISMSMIIYYWTEMLQAVKDIHDQGIIHSDLKPANFLLVSGRLKLIDFGIASSQGDMTSVVKEVTTGTWNYMSPEAIKNTSTSGKGFKITYKSDVWSLGCILYNLVYGKTPFSHITNTWGKLTAIADPNHCIEFPDVGAPVVLVKALRSCFHREPKLRPTVAELLSLPYHSTGDGSDLNSVGRQVQTILPMQWWLKVAHLFPGVKPNQEGKTSDNAG